MLSALCSNKINVSEIPDSKSVGLSYGQAGGEPGVHSMCAYEHGVTEVKTAHTHITHAYIHTGTPHICLHTHSHTTNIHTHTHSHTTNIHSHLYTQKHI